MGIDYNDIDSIIARIPENWWISTAESCKYMLACFVHKHIPDLNIDPKAAPVGTTRELWCKMKKAALEEVRAVAKADRPVGKGVEKYGDVNQQIKMARVDGMRSQWQRTRLMQLCSRLR